MAISERNTSRQTGYKQTEVGFIPEDWKVEKLGHCLSTKPQYGINAPAIQYTDKLPTYIRITDITDDGYFSPEKIASVRHFNANQYALKVDDFVFARTGASVGKTYLYKPKDGFLVFAGYLIRVKVDPSKLLVNYLAAYVKTKHYWSWVRATSMRSGQPGINGNEYAQLPIPLPPLPEQQAIATVLSDVDALITSLNKLIAKKRDIKQATMQELLTGKTRLPGFSGEWEMKKLGEIAELTSSKRIFEHEYVSSGIPFYRGKEISRLIDYKEIDDEYFIAESRYDQIKSEFGVPNQGDILITAVGSLGNVYVIPDKNKFYFKDGNLIWLRNIKKANPYYIALQMKRKKAEIVNSAIGTSQKALTIIVLRNILLPLPSSSEQQAIATILSDMDAEIVALEQKRDKTRALKQGMMQELLTGKTRLYEHSRPDRTHDAESSGQSLQHATEL